MTEHATSSSSRQEVRLSRWEKKLILDSLRLVAMSPITPFKTTRFRRLVDLALKLEDAGW
jgi:hypothetical protein